MKIIIKRLELLNFKGIRSLPVEFNEHVQDIRGANETGKSTIFNAFLWLLFGKDMEGRKDYEIKTTDANGQELHKLDHQVTGIFDVDGQELTLRRLYKEKWVKARGAAIPELEGHTTEFFWNDVPCREKDYQEKINGLMKEDVFKLLTNPLFFNTGLTGYKIPDWQARRNVLIELGGKIDDRAIAGNDPRFIKLLDSLAGKSIEDYRKQLSAQKKKLQEQLDAIPTRIDEATRAIPTELDFEAIARQILAKEKEIAQVDQALADVSESGRLKNEERLGLQDKIFTHKMRLQAIESEIRSQFQQDKNTRDSQIRELRATGRSKDLELENLGKDRKRMEDVRAGHIARMEQLKKDWFALNEKQPDAPKNDCTCPACGQELPADKLSEKKATYDKYVADFNGNKLRRLSEITSEGLALKEKVEGLNKSLEDNASFRLELMDAISALRAQIAELEAEAAEKSREADRLINEQIDSNEEGKLIRSEMEDIQAKFLAIQNDAPDNSELKTKRQGLVAELDALKKQRDVKEQIERGRNRVADLEKEEQQLSAQLVEVEGIDFVIQEFIRARINTLESRINGKFAYARFKLFDEQVNGQTVECCETMYKGVVWGSLNTAARVQVGLDIIDTLSTHYGVRAPIFIDNRESISVIPNIDSQIINLIVSEKDKQLRVA